MEVKSMKIDGVRMFKKVLIDEKVIRKQIKILRAKSAKELKASELASSSEPKLEYKYYGRHEGYEHAANLLTAMLRELKKTEEKSNV